MIVVREPLGQRAYRALKQMIIDGDLAPGDELGENALATRLGLSRSPVKAALTRLQDDGLIVGEAWKVLRVAPLDSDYVTKVYELRRALDSLCAERSTPRIPEAEIDALKAEWIEARKSLKNDDFEPVRRLNFHFNDILIEYCGNELLQSFIGRLQDHLARIRNASPQERKEWFQWEHEFLGKEIKAVTDRDSEQLVNLLKVHLDSFRKEIAKVWPLKEG